MVPVRSQEPLPEEFFLPQLSLLRSLNESEEKRRFKKAFCPCSYDSCCFLNHTTSTPCQLAISKGFIAKSNWTQVCECRKRMFCNSKMKQTKLISAGKNIGMLNSARLWSWSRDWKSNCKLLPLDRHQLYQQHEVILQARLQVWQSDNCVRLCQQPPIVGHGWLPERDANRWHHYLRHLHWQECHLVFLQWQLRSKLLAHVVLLYQPWWCKIPQLPLGHIQPHSLLCSLLRMYLLTRKTGPTWT